MAIRLERYPQSSYMAKVAQCRTCTKAPIAASDRPLCDDDEDGKDAADTEDEDGGSKTLRA